MHTPTRPDDTRATAKAWIATAGALFFCIIAAPLLVEAAATAVLP